MYSAWLEKAKRAAELEAPVVEDTGEDSQRSLFLETSPEQPFLGPFPAPSQASSSGPSGPRASRASFEQAWIGELGEVQQRLVKGP